MSFKSKLRDTLKVLKFYLLNDFLLKPIETVQEPSTPIPRGLADDYLFRAKNKSFNVKEIPYHKNKKLGIRGDGTGYILGKDGFVNESLDAGSLLRILTNEYESDELGRMCHVYKGKKIPCTPELPEHDSFTDVEFVNLSDVIKDSDFNNFKVNMTLDMNFDFLKNNTLNLTGCDMPSNTKLVIYENKNDGLSFKLIE